MVSNGSWISSVKLILISAGFISVAIAIKFSLPAAVDGIPAIWSVILSWMKPPYLYIIINGIIISIAAVSRFSHGKSEQQTFRSENSISFKTPPPVIFESLPSQAEVKAVVEASKASDEAGDREDRAVELQPALVNGSMIRIGEEEEIRAQSEAEHVSMAYRAALEQNDSPELDFQSLMRGREKPLVSSRFAPRKPTRANPEGVRSLKVSRPKKHDTLESTWRTITEGRHVPLTRHHRKSDTWGEHHHQAPASASAVDPAIESDSPRWMIRNEPSLGHEDLNRRVESFIKKFNEEMRMQRQESLERYVAMVKRGV